MNCAECGHSIELHGRRGHGSCRHNRYGGLAKAVETVRVCVAAGVSKDKTSQLVDQAFEATPCECKRFRKRSP